MFDITSSKLLILGIVALLVIGPKDLPALLRTIGKYIGIIRRQAAEFRAQFEEAMRESELQQVKKELETVGQETEASMRAAERSVESQLADAQRSVDSTMAGDPMAPPATAAADPLATDPYGLPMTSAPAPAEAPQPALNGAAHPAEAPAGPEKVASEAGGAGAKTGA